MSWFQRQDCDDKFQDRTLRRQLLCDKLDKIQAVIKKYKRNL